MDDCAASHLPDHVAALSPTVRRDAFPYAFYVLNTRRRALASLDVFPPFRPPTLLRAKKQNPSSPQLNSAAPTATAKTVWLPDQAGRGHARASTAISHTTTPRPLLEHASLTIITCNRPPKNAHHLVAVYSPLHEFPHPPPDASNHVSNGQVLPQPHRPPSPVAQELPRPACMHLSLPRLPFPGQRQRKILHPHATRRRKCPSAFFSAFPNIAVSINAENVRAARRKDAKHFRHQFVGCCVTGLFHSMVLFSAGKFGVLRRACSFAPVVPPQSAQLLS